jgi:hypothetical protein
MRDIEFRGKEALNPCKCGGKCECRVYRRPLDCTCDALFYVRCIRCNLAGPIKSSEEAAIAAWNKRATEENK